MSRTTTHCVCTNNDEPADTTSKAYSILPNYMAKTDNNQQSPDFCTVNKNFIRNHNFSSPNYENIEQFLSGTFTSHSCANKTKEDCLVTGNRQKVVEKCSKSTLKPEKVYAMKHLENDETITPRLGLDACTNNYCAPDTGRSPHRTVHSVKKQSCGLKYIIFHKLSIMTHFLTKSRDKPLNLTMSRTQLSDENLFSTDEQCQTKRSKSFQTMATKTARLSEVDGRPNSLAHKPTTQRANRRTKESDTSNSSMGSIDAHAGSPITIMSTAVACGNFVSGLSNPLMANTLSAGKQAASRNQWRQQYASPDTQEFSQKKTHQKPTFNHSHHNPSPFCPAHPNYHCSNCVCHAHQSCHPMIYEQMCRPRCYTQSPISAQCPTHHCRCCFCVNHSHVHMHSPFPQSPPLCCNPPNYFYNCQRAAPSCCHQLHSPNVCQFDYRARSTLCNSCHFKNVKRCQSETLDDTRRCADHIYQPHLCNQTTSNNVRYKLKSESKPRLARPSPSIHSKSVASSIPPPPPPPPSSLYSANDAVSQKSKHRKQCHHRVDKFCDSCNVTIPQIAHSPDCTNNVQNIIYSHLNNTAACTLSKVDDDLLSPHQHRSYSYDDHHAANGPKTLRYKSSKGQIAEKSDNENEKDKEPLFSSKKRGTDYRQQKEVYDRRSAEMVRDNQINPKPKFLSKTPETYKSKHERHHKKHQYETQRMSKHKSISTTREYKIIENDLFYRDDSMDSPEAGSFIYHPISSLGQTNTQPSNPKMMSSFNNRQHCNYKDVSYERTELVRKAFQENMLSLKEVGWYWGPLSFTEAESLMENKANGTFLVRDSGHDTYFLSLTFRVRETTYHTRIEYSQGTFSFWSQPESHSATTIVEFIDKAVAHSQSGKFHYFLLTNVPGQPPMEVSLLYPLSRHQIVHSLKHMSRFVILNHIRKDHIVQLSVPPPLRMYLLEKQYYISNLDEFITMTMDTHPLSYKPSTIN